MIYGIGADVVEVPRVQRLLDRYGLRFARRILAPSELDGFARSGDPPAYLAARFAAKEAFAKAFGTGLRGVVTFTHVAVIHDVLGKPHLQLAPEVARLTANRGVGASHVTLSHERSIACAFVVLEVRDT